MSQILDFSIDRRIKTKIINKEYIFELFYLRDGTATIDIFDNEGNELSLGQVVNNYIDIFEVIRSLGVDEDQAIIMVVPATTEQNKIAITEDTIKNKSTIFLVGAV